MSAVEGSSAVLVGGTILEARDLVLSFGETPALRGAEDVYKRQGIYLAESGAALERHQREDPALGQVTQ